MAVRGWDGNSYDRVSAPMEAMGREVLGRLPLNGGEVVLDAGCGSGRVTEALIERLPRGAVIALDVSASMVAVARQRLGDRADVRLGDLLDLALERPVDAVLSTATFHWIADHDRLYAKLHRALRPGGRLVAQCGGEGNVGSVRATAADVAAQPRFAEHFAGWHGPWNYTSPEQAQASLERAGFQEIRCWMTEVTVRPDQPREYLSTILLGPYLEQLPEELRDGFVDDVLGRLGQPLELDYRRLNIDAVA